MGGAADRKVTERVAAKVAEIEATRKRLEEDFVELEARIPVPVRSAKSLLGLLAGTAVSLMILERIRPKRKPKPTEVVIRVVRDDR